MWSRLPGLDHKLREAWSGPWEIVERLNRVNYRIRLADGTGRPKVVYINTLKTCVEREEPVRRLTVVADDGGGTPKANVRLKMKHAEYVEEDVRKLRDEFCVVLVDTPGNTESCSISVEVGDVTPINQAPYRVPERLKDGVRSEMEKLVEAGIIYPSNSPWASPIVPVVKPDGTVRLCVDNAVTQQDPYYMPTLEEILERVGSCCFLTKLDLSKGYYQVKVAEDSRKRTAFISPFCKYEFSRMPFGLRNAPAVFQRLMDAVLGPCYGFAAPYMDDVLIFSSGWDEHLLHVRKVLEELRRHGLTAKPAKCEWGMCYVEYLGHVVGSGTVAVPEMRVKAMANFAQPVTKRDMRAFLGAIGYYRKFIPQFAKYSSVLTPAIRNCAPGKVLWSSEMVMAFRTLRSVLSNVCALHVPVPLDVFSLHTDASACGVGAVLNVERDGVVLPVAFFSRQLRGPETRYSTTELEGLAVYCAVMYFAHFLYGRTFKVFTDHKALVAFRSSKVLNRRLQGWTLRMQDFDFSVCTVVAVITATRMAYLDRQWRL